MKTYHTPPIWPPDPVAPEPEDDNGAMVPANRVEIRKLRTCHTSLLGACLFFSLLFVAGFLFGDYELLHSHTQNDREMGLQTSALSLLLLGFFGPVSLGCWVSMQALARTLNENLPALLINRDGITDYSSDGFVGQIHWSEIAEVRSAFRRGSSRSTSGIYYPGVAIVIKDQKAFLKRLPTLTALMTKLDFLFVSFAQPANGRDKIFSVFVSQSMLDIPVSELLERVRLFRERAGC